MNKCLTCKKETNNKKYCSKSCSNMSRGFKKNVCIICNKKSSFLFKESSPDRYFCSIKCTEEFNKLNKIVEIKGGRPEKIKKWKIFQKEYCPKNFYISREKELKNLGVL